MGGSFAVAGKHNFCIELIEDCMNIKIISALFVLVMFPQSPVYAQADLLGALNLGQGAGLLSSVPVFGGGVAGLDSLPLSILTSAATPFLAQSQNVAPLLELLPISQLIVPAAPVLGLAVTDLPVGTIAAQGVEAGVMFADVLTPGEASFNSLWIAILGFQ